MVITKTGKLLLTDMTPFVFLEELPPNSDNANFRRFVILIVFIKMLKIFPDKFFESLH